MQRQKFNDSLEYVKQEEPSFRNNDQNYDSVFEHLQIKGKESTNRIESLVISPIKPNINKNLTQQRLLLKKQQFIDKVQELKLHQQFLHSKIAELKRYFNNYVIGEIKKQLFSIFIQFEKEKVSFMKNNRSLPKDRSIDSQQKQNVQQEIYMLRDTVGKLEQDKIQSQKRYEQTLKKYQIEIESLAQIIEQNEEQRNYLLKRDQSSDRENMEIESYKQYLQQEKQNHKKSIRALEEKILAIENDFQALSIEKYDIEQKLKAKERQVFHRESEIQIKLKAIQNRQTDVRIAEQLLSRQRNELSLRQEKISDYELKIVREERKQKQLLKQQEIMTSEYYTQNDKNRILMEKAGNINAKIPTDRCRQRSHSRQSSQRSCSRVDISARLRQIAEMKKARGSTNLKDNDYKSKYYDNRLYNRGSSSASSVSSSRPRLNQREKSIESNSIGQSDYGSVVKSSKTINLRHQNSLNSGGLGSKAGSFKLSEKMDSLTQNLQKELREIRQ